MREKIKFTACIALGIITAVQFNRTQADTQIDTNSGSANTYINVTAPTTNNLYLTQAPDFNFSNTEASTSKAVTVTGTVPYNIVNITGTTNGYNLQQKISHFTATVDGRTVTLPLKYFKISVADNTSGTVKGSKGVNILGQAGRVLTGQKNAQGSQTSGATAAEIQLDTTQGIKPGDYQATITNTIVQGL